MFWSATTLNSHIVRKRSKGTMYYFLKIFMQKFEKGHVFLNCKNIFNLYQDIYSARLYFTIPLQCQKVAISLLALEHFYRLIRCLSVLISRSPNFMHRSTTSCLVWCLNSESVCFILEIYCVWFTIIRYCFWFSLRTQNLPGLPTIRLIESTFFPSENH